MNEYEIASFHKIRQHTDLPPDVVSGLRLCISSAFGGRVTEDDASNHMSGDQILIAHPKEIAAVTNTREVVGFSSTSIISPRKQFGDNSYPDTKGAYFAAAAVAETVQGCGLYHTLNDLRLGYALGQGTSLVFTRTQNPRVQEGITAAVDRLVEAGKVESYEIGRMLLKGTYGTMLTPTKPNAHRLTYDELDHSKGDAFIISWHLQRPKT